MIRVSLPARINIVGSPTDACEGAYATLTAAVERRGGAEIEAASAAPTDASAIVTAAVAALCRHVPGLTAAMAERPAAIRTWTDIPASSGLAGSSVLLLAVLAVLRLVYALDPRRWNDYALAEIAQRAEEHDLGVVCGFADRYAPLFGDLAYIDYHGKLWHAPLGEEPYATYEKLGALAPPARWAPSSPAPAAAAPSSPCRRPARLRRARGPGERGVRRARGTRRIAGRHVKSLHRRDAETRRSSSLGLLHLCVSASLR